MTDSCAVQLVGGLGNQLFGVAFGRYLEHRFGVSVRYLEASDKGPNKNHSNNLSGVNVFGSEVKTTPVSYLDSLRLAASSVRMGKFVRVLTEPSIDISNHRPAKYEIFRGYFQTVSPYLYLRSVGQGRIEYQPGIRKPEASLPKLAGSEEWGAIHMRFGDYRGSVSHNVLPFKYYLRACEAARAALPELSGFTIFSDSPEEASKYRARLRLAFADIEFQMIEKKSNVDALTSMLTMANYKALITANSTFSLWGGLLGDAEKTVFFPDPWFSAAETLVPEVPNDWSPVSARD